MPDLTAGRPVAGQPIETAWGQQVHDAIELARRVERGVFSVPAGGTQGEFSVTFGTAFATVPTVLLSPVSPQPGTLLVASLTIVSTSGFTAEIEKTDGSTTPATPCYWIALGS